METTRREMLKGFGKGLLGLTVSAAAPATVVKAVTAAPAAASLRGPSLSRGPTTFDDFVWQVREFFGLNRGEVSRAWDPTLSGGIAPQGGLSLNDIQSVSSLVDLARSYNCHTLFYSQKEGGLLCLPEKMPEPRIIDRVV